MSLLVVAPVHNEAAVLGELAARCLRAARHADPAARVLLVDDASTDTTPELSRSLPEGVAVRRLTRNRGQLGATKAGLIDAEADVVVVIDGDLQDPPEHLVALVAALRANPALDVVFATRLRREDPAWFRLGRALYAQLLRVPGARGVPSGAGAYCAMRGALARRVGAVRVQEANLAPLLLALGARAGSVPCDRQARYDGASRVGPLGLVREALASLALTGALERLIGVLGLTLLVTAGVRRQGPLAAIGLATLGGAAWLRHARCDMLEPSPPKEDR